MNNDGTYFQLTALGPYYPSAIDLVFDYEGLSFFVSPLLLSDSDALRPSDMQQSQFFYSVTHKDTGRSVGDTLTTYSPQVAKDQAIAFIDQVGLVAIKRAIRNHLDRPTSNKL